MGMLLGLPVALGPGIDYRIPFPTSAWYTLLTFQDSTIYLPLQCNLLITVQSFPHQYPRALIYSTTNSHYAILRLCSYSVWYPWGPALCLTQLRTQYQFVEFNWFLFQKLCLILFGQCVLETVLGRTENPSSSFSCNDVFSGQGGGVCVWRGESLTNQSLGEFYSLPLKKHAQSREPHLQT